MIEQVAPPDLSKLRHVFNQRRAASHMTYDELAEATGVSRRTLVNLGTGKYQGDLRTWLILSRAWGIDLDELLQPVWV